MLPPSSHASHVLLSSLAHPLFLSRPIAAHARSSADADRTISSDPGPLLRIADLGVEVREVAGEEGRDWTEEEPEAGPCADIIPCRKPAQGSPL
eukprot:888515-Rhodomonas_salina.1